MPVINYAIAPHRSIATIIIAIASLIQTTLIATAVLVKATKR